MTRIEKMARPPEELRYYVHLDAFDATTSAWVGKTDEGELRGCLGLVPLQAISGEWYAWFWMKPDPTKDELRLIRNTWRDEVVPGRQQIVASATPGCEWAPRWMRWLGMTFYEEAGGFAWYYRKA